MRKWIAVGALAAVQLGAEAPPTSISVASGAFDVLRPYRMSVEFDLECKFGGAYLRSPFRFLFFRPLAGAMGTIEGTTYLYGGINFDLLCGPYLVIVPGFAAGWYRKGGGKDLGYPLEFRSGVEMAWRFSDGRRLGIHFYHLSNASLGKRNPGEESLVLFYDIPINKVFRNR